MDKIYIVEDYNSGEFYGFKTVEGARLYIMSIYSKSLRGFITKERVIDEFSNDLITLASKLPYVEDFAYTKECSIMD